MARNENRFEIDLDRSRSPRAFRDHQNLWHDDLGRLYQLISRHVSMISEAVKDRARGSSNDDDGDLPHLSIAIFGPSGSGKSSLLRTLTDDIERSKCAVRPKSLEGKIATLPVMDPTTWAESDQFLYAFLASALEKENDSLDESEYGYPKGLSPVQLAFQEVNEYLRVIDEPEHAEEHDPLGLSLQKLERHTSGLRLKSSLGKFIRALANSLRADVVLLPVDDLDLAPNHLVRALQSYQSFLTHGRLVPVFSFTDRMPEELIEVYYQHTLRDRQRLHPVEGATARLSISEQLAVQFLARCFPVRNRIRLGPAPARVQRAQLVVRVDRDRDNICAGEPRKQQVFELLTTASFLLFGHPDREDAHQVKAALRPSTLRRQFQVIDAMADCRLYTLRTPQLGVMAKLEPRDIEEIATHGTLKVFRSSKEVETWAVRPQDLVRHERMRDAWPNIGSTPSESRLEKFKDSLVGYEIVAQRMNDLGREATWAKVFNSATWSLLNVHRDTLRELGLFLEDLYSWSPKELRSVVIENILTQERSVRRTVVDRWFNRTDYRRSQVLSLLAANIFRPWMRGEEPYGDEETPVRQRLELERQGAEVGQFQDLDFSAATDKESSDPERLRQIDGRLTIPAPKGLLWFLNVTLGFYLPQIMARNWSQAISTDEPIRGRMNGYGWDLQHAPINAARIADAKAEAFSFGMIFLDTKAYEEKLEDTSARDDLASHLLFRIWSCFGYNAGRFWACFSMWRGLGFIGQAIELVYRHPDFCNEQGQLEDKDGRLSSEFARLIRSHCLGGLVPGSLLAKNADPERLAHGIPEFRPWDEPIKRSIEQLAKEVVEWLKHCWPDLVFPLPGGTVTVGWSDCFVRRIHGEYILGSLWPRLDAAYLEKQPGAKTKELAGQQVEHFWTAAQAANDWSSYLLQYWRSCPAILKLLLTCPIFIKSERYFHQDFKDLYTVIARGEKLEDLQKLPRKGTKKRQRLDEAYAWLDRLHLPTELATRLADMAKQQRFPASVNEVFEVDRVNIEQFLLPNYSHHKVKYQPWTEDNRAPTEEPQ